MQNNIIEVARKKSVWLMVWSLLSFLVIPFFIGWFYAFYLLGVTSQIDNKYQDRLSAGRVFVIVGFFIPFFHFIGGLVLLLSLNSISENDIYN